MARVPVGECTAARSGLRSCQPQPDNNPRKRYDSVVDDVNNPSIVFVFNFAQFYHEHLITFQ